MSRKIERRSWFKRIYFQLPNGWLHGESKWFYLDDSLYASDYKKINENGRLEEHCFYEGGKKCHRIDRTKI